VELYTISINNWREGTVTSSYLLGILGWYIKCEWIPGILQTGRCAGY
jgi:hypothetical protein